MSLLSLIFALLLEQLYPLALRRNLHAGLGHYVDFFHRYLHAGHLKHGRIAWLVVILLPLIGTVCLYWLMYWVHPVFALLFNVLVLYFTLGFRQFIRSYTDIHQALRDHDLDKARNLLSAWRASSCHELKHEEVARVTIEEGLLAAHRYLFGVITWFVVSMFLGLGPAGAVLYRMAHFIDQLWDHEDPGDLGVFARQAYRWVEWLPMRVTAMIFAIVGDFEDTLYCWRSQSQSWPDPVAGVVLASAAGAIGVRLGLPILQAGLPQDRPELGIGEDADVDFMQSTVGLVWRALVFWFALLLLFGLATLVKF